LPSDQQDLLTQCLAKAYQERIDALKGNIKPPDAAASGFQPTIEIDADERADAAKSSWLALARIQTNMEHVAAGKPQLPHGDDKLEQIVDAYAAFMTGDFDGMDKLLIAVKNEALVRQRSPAFENLDYEPTFGQKEDYFQKFSDIGNGGSPLLRLVVTMRQVDAILFAEAGSTHEGIGLFGDLGNRYLNQGHSDIALPYAETWLKLPCRTIAGRVAAFDEVGEKLGKLSGGLLSCPSGDWSFSELALLAGDARLFFPCRAPSYNRTELPLDQTPAAQRERRHKKAVELMNSNPTAAEPVLEEDAGFTDEWTLDYALYLHTFVKPNADRNAKINEALASLIGNIKTAYSNQGKSDTLVKAYDGTDDALIDLLNADWETGSLQSYTVPCAVLLKHPSFLATMGDEWGTSMDRFRARSGCDSEADALPDFPQKELDAYLSLVDEAQSYAWERFDGTMKYGRMAGQYAAITEMKIAPSVIGKDAPTFDYPYQVWGLLGPSNYQVSQKIRSAYDDLLAKLTIYNLHRGLRATDATVAAKQSLFRIADGADCGKRTPKQSVRQLLLQGEKFATVADIADSKEAPEVLDCARVAGLEPLSLVATADPSALAMLLSNGGNVNERSSIGKTPLMMAAQLNRLESVKLLLTAHAKVNLVTWKKPSDYEDSLADDSRTALMYAAANGSLDMIKILVANGADPYQSDTKGKRAIDYLLGYGPVPANPNLSAVERQEAIGLLY